MGLSCTISEKNGDFSQKSQIFHTPCNVFNAQGVPLELGSTRWPRETKMIGLPRQERSLRISLAIWIKYMSVMDKQTDRQTDTENRQTDGDRPTASTKLTHIFMQ